ncbi:hypothetical protein D9M68_17860 [compost metagenome]
MIPEEAVAKWQAIYEQSLAMIDPTPDEIWNGGGFLYEDGRPSWRSLCDLRTIHMGGGRQNGKNTWAREFMAAHPKAIMVECNAGLRDITVDHWRGPGDGRLRVFTIMDIVSISKHSYEDKLTFLSEASHIIFNDASHNVALPSTQFSHAANGLFTKDVIVIRLG